MSTQEIENSSRWAKCSYQTSDLTKQPNAIDVPMHFYWENVTLDETDEAMKVWLANSSRPRHWPSENVGPPGHAFFAAEKSTKRGYLQSRDYFREEESELGFVLCFSFISSPLLLMHKEFMQGGWGKPASLPKRALPRLPWVIFWCCQPKNNFDWTELN